MTDLTPNLPPTELLALIVPLLLLELGVIVLALRDLLRPERRVRYLTKNWWAVVIVVFNLLGSLAYFVLGREEG